METYYDKTSINSILGGTFFLIYINDIVKELSANFRLFTYDRSLHIIVEDPISAAKKVREKSTECQNHKPQPFPDTKRKRKQKN